MRQAHDPNTHSFVIANAGAGKTFTLTRRVARLLLTGAKPDSILCLTYTKAAATEMRERLFALLGEWATADDNILRRQLSELEGKPKEYAPDDLRQARTLFASALETPGGLRIQTLHAFAEHVLRRFPLEAGVTPGFQVLDDTQIETIRQNALSQITMHENTSVKDAFAVLVTHLDENRLDLSLRDAFYSAKHIQAAITTAGGIDALVKGIWEKQGFSKPLSEDEILADVTYICDSSDILALINALRSGSKTDINNANILAKLLPDNTTTQQRWQHLKQFAFTGDGEGDPRKRLITKTALKDNPDAEAALTELQSQAVEIRDKIRRAQTARQTAAVTIVAHHAHTIYQNLKREDAAVDFDDMIHATARLLSNTNSNAWVLYKLDAKLQHILIDEAQDTAPEQWQMVDGLTSEFFASETVLDAPRTLFAVGDLKQSIYSFQGAEPQQFLDATQTYERKARESGQSWLGVSLDKSYRTVPQVLTFVDAVLQLECTRTLIPEQDPANLPHHDANRSDTGVVELWSPLEIETDTTPKENWTAPVDQRTPDDPKLQLAKQIAQRVKHIIQTGVCIQDKETGPRAAHAGDVMILLQSRGPLFRDMINELRAHNIPVAGADRLSVFETTAVIDIIRLARVGLMPLDDLKLAEVLRSPLCDVSEDSLFDLAYGRDCNMWQTLQDRHMERPEWQQAYTMIHWANKAACHLSPYIFFQNALHWQDEAGRHNMRARLVGRLGPESQDALDALLTHAQNFTTNQVGHLHHYLEHIDTTQLDIKREMEAAGNAVRVMTIHGSKGLEAPIVFLPDCTRHAQKRSGLRSPLVPHPDFGVMWPAPKDDHIQHILDHKDAADYAEYLRLFYVAITRARDMLVVCGALNKRQKAPKDGCWINLAQQAFDDMAKTHTIKSEQFNDIAIRTYGNLPTIDERTAAPAVDQSQLPEWTIATHQPDQLPQTWTDTPSLPPTLGIDVYQRGTLIHKLLAAVADVSPDAQMDYAQAILGQEAHLQTELHDDIIDAVFAVLNHPDCAPAFGPGSRAEVPIAGTIPHYGFVQGRIDRLVKTDTGYLILDFKTNRPAPKTKAGIPQSYREQFWKYAQLIKATGGNPTVDMAIIWTDGPRVMRLNENDLASPHTLETADRST